MRPQGTLALLQLSLTGIRIAKHILHTAHTPRPTERTVCSPHTCAAGAAVTWQQEHEGLLQLLQ